MENNNLLKVLQDLYNDYSKNGDAKKTTIIRIFFECRIIDVCNYNIFQLSSFLDQLSPIEDKITYEQFLQLIFYIYSQQLKNTSGKKDENGNDVDKSSNDSQINLPDMSSVSVSSLMESVNVNNNSNNNIIKILMDLREKNQKFYNLCCPVFNPETNPDIEFSLKPELLNAMKNFSKSCYDKMFSNYIRHEELKNIDYINISDLNNIFFDFPIYKNFDCTIIGGITRKNLFPREIHNQKVDKFYLIFDEKLSTEQIKEEFNKIYLDYIELNFTFSTFIMILAQFSFKYLGLGNDEKNKVNGLEFFFEKILELEKDYIHVEESIKEDSIQVIEEDYFPASKIYEEALRMQSNPSQEDNDFVQDCLMNLDKDLPDMPDIIKSFQNSMPQQSNTLFYHKSNNIAMKFPLNILKVEVEEENKKKSDELDRLKILNAKKVKKANARDPPVKQIIFADQPSLEKEKIKFFGNKTIEDLKQRLLKNSFKEILLNSNVYPSLLKEILIIPKNTPKNVSETILLGMKDMTNGQFDIAIRKFERAEIELNIVKNVNVQIDLFFNLQFGNIYESLELNLMALRYYYKCKLLSDKLYGSDPDGALVYSNLGSIMIKLREYEWAFRCFTRAQELRENTIGGDTLDTATIYNNLGVVCHYLQSFYPAHGYFTLAHSIYKKYLGLFHQRTLMIKSNLTKMRHLNFSKPFEFKTMGVYPAIIVEIKNDKKKSK